MRIAQADGVQCAGIEAGERRQEGEGEQNRHRPMAGRVEAMILAEFAIGHGEGLRLPR
jgi:hypothetical protein